MKICRLGGGITWSRAPNKKVLVINECNHIGLGFIRVYIYLLEFR